MAQMTMRFDRRTVPVGSIEEAVQIWNDYRDSTGMGASEIGEGATVREGRREVAHISYNGRVWPAGHR